MQQLTLDGYDPVFGARPLKRLIQREIVDRIAGEMVRGNVLEGAHATIDLDDGLRYTCKVENQAGAAPVTDVAPATDEVSGAFDDFELPAN